MKRLLLRLLAAIGLVPLRRYKALSKSADRLRAEASDWKHKARESMAAVKSLNVEAQQQARLVEKLGRSHEEIQGLRDSLARVEGELSLAREHQMAIEVKLDILEGAANVLDLRTRAAIARQPSGSSAPS